jgi:predicted dehydrogenase
MTDRKLKVAVVGLGAVAFKSDVKGIKRGRIPRTHIGALSRLKQYQIRYLVDPKRAQAQLIKKHYRKLKNVKALKTLHEVSEQLDVIVLSTPVQNRLKLVKKTVLLKPKLIVIEKPLAKNYKLAMAIIDCLKKSSIPALINYPRRFDKKYLILKNKLKESPEKIVMVYNNGLLNYCSHHLDLLIDWFGDVKSIQYIKGNSKSNPSFVCEMKRGFYCYVLGISDVNYDLFDMEIFFKGKKIRVMNGGCEKTIQNPKVGLYYPGYSQLSSESHLDSSGQVSGFIELYENISEHLYKGKSLKGATIEHSSIIYNIFNAVDQSRKQDGKIVKL